MNDDDPRPVVPAPRMAPGWSPTRTTAREMARARRTYYRTVSTLVHEDLVRSLGRGRTIDTRRFTTLEWDRQEYGGRPVPTIRCAPYFDNRDPFIDLQMPDQARVLDWLDDGTKWKVVFEPAWYRDMVAWYEDLARRQRRVPVARIEAMADWDRSPCRHPRRMLECAAHYAADRGYAIVLPDEGICWIVRPADAWITGTWPAGSRSTGFRFADPPAYRSSSGDAGSDPRELRESVGRMQSACATITRINGEMRQREHTMLQDLELDLLTIAAARRLLQALSAFEQAIREGRASRVGTVARRMAMPGAGIRPQDRRPGEEQWPDRLVDLARRPRTGDPVTAGRRLCDAVGALVRTASMDEQFVAGHLALGHRFAWFPGPVDEQRRAIPGLTGALLASVGWQRGAEDIKDYIL